MAIELLLSVAVVGLIGGMTWRERLSTPDPQYPKASGWRAIATRADLFLMECAILCLAILWLPLLFR